MHRSHVIFRLGHDNTRVSAVPKTATQTPISVSSASVDRPCDWTNVPAVESRSAAYGITAAWETEILCALNSNKMKSGFILGRLTREGLGNEKSLAGMDLRLCFEYFEL